WTNFIFFHTELIRSGVSVARVTGRDLGKRSRPLVIDSHSLWGLHGLFGVGGSFPCWAISPPSRQATSALVSCGRRRPHRLDPRRLWHSAAPRHHLLRHVSRLAPVDGDVRSRFLDQLALEPRGGPRELRGLE